MVEVECGCLLSPKGVGEYWGLGGCHPLWQAAAGGLAPGRGRPLQEASGVHTLFMRKACLGTGGTEQRMKGSMSTSRPQSRNHSSPRSRLSSLKEQPTTLGKSAGTARVATTGHRVQHVDLTHRCPRGPAQGWTKQAPVTTHGGLKDAYKCFRSTRGISVLHPQT